MPAGDKRVTKGVCMWCHSHCHVSVVVENGELVRVEEDKDHPHAKPLAATVRGCPRARAAREIYHHPDRLNYPLKRAGERGEGRWQIVSWENALDEIAERLKSLKGKYGAETLATCIGTGRTVDEYRARFFNLFGSPNLIGQGQICFGPTNLMAWSLMGCADNHTGLRPGVTRGILLMGANPEQSGRRLWLAITETKATGAKLIVIDPRRTGTAEKADIWLQLRPGTDCALLMSMINVIITEELYDREFVSRWCYGFDKLAERAREYPPEKVAEIAWVPADQIRQAARLYAASKPATSMNMMGVEHLSNSAEALHARYALVVITGNIDVRGGDMLRSHHPKYISAFQVELNDKLSPEQQAKAQGADQFRLFSWHGYELIREPVKRVWGKEMRRHAITMAHAPTIYRAMFTGKPYPVRAMLTMAANPMVTEANTKLVYKALKSLDLHVVADHWLTPTAELADYVLPAACWLERPFIHTFFESADFIEGGEEALPPKVEGVRHRKTDYDILRELGIRLGQGDYWPWPTLEASYDYRLAPLGCTFKEFMSQRGGRDSVPVGYKKYEQTGFGTLTGKVELYSTVLEKLGYDPLPRYREPHESPVSTPELARDYPLVLTTGGRIQPYFHSEHRQVEACRRQYPQPVVEINPQTASELGIQEGDWTWIETLRGRVMQKCHYFDGIDPRVVHAQHGWWFPEQPGEEPWLHGVWQSNVDVLTDDDPAHCNPITGGWPLRAMLCRIYKVKQY